MSARHKTAFGRRAEFYDRIVSDPRPSRAAIAVAWRLVNHINERTVRRGVDQLVAAGWITKNGGVLELAEGS